MSCKDVFTDEERRHLEEVLHGDLDGYWEEMKNMVDIVDFNKWKNLTLNILKKCDLNKWDIPPQEKKAHTPREERKQQVQKLMRKMIEKED